MRSLLIISCLLFATFSHGQIETQRGVSAEVPTKKVSEAKSLLIHVAVLEAISEFSNVLGVNAEDFKNKLEDSFRNYFARYKERMLSEKFGKDYSASLTDEQKKTFLEGLDKNRAMEFIKFSKLDRLLDSYAFRQIANDPAEGDLWKAVVVLKLNKLKVQKQYSRLTTNEAKQFSSIQILTEITPMGFTWGDLAVEKSTSFSSPMMDSWIKWFSNNPASNVDEIISCNDECLQDFSDWELIPQEEGMRIPGNLLNSLWLKVFFNLRKVSFTAGINEWAFEWDGSVVLLDANTKKNLFSYTMKTQRKTWRGLDQKALNSALVSSMYRSPLDAFSKVVRKIQDTPRINRLSRLVVRGYKNMDDVLLLIDLLRKEGGNIGLELVPDFFTRNEAQLICFYQGEEKLFTDLLSRAKELKSSQSYRLVNEFTGVHHILKLIAE